ncbi:MAG: hypothetical protein AB8G26_12855 [Ilumatobacter sp.]
MNPRTIDTGTIERDVLVDCVRTALSEEPLWAEGSFGTTLAFVYRGDRHPTFDPSIVVADVPLGGPDLSTHATSVELARSTSADGSPRRLTFLESSRTGSMTTEVIVADHADSLVQITACAAEGDVGLIAGACERIVAELADATARDSASR